MKKSFLFALGALVSGSLLSGCGSGSDGGSSVTYGPLAGTWRATALTSGGEDVPCPARIVASGTTTQVGQTLPQFGCGAADTIEFRGDNTFVASRSATPQSDGAAFMGRWTQFQTRVLLTVDDAQSSTFPYSTELFFRNRNQFTAPVAGVPSQNRYVFTRQ